MNGQLSKQPLAELIREISSKSLTGRLRLEHDRVQVVAYFDRGQFVYAASNVRTLRLREYLKKAALVSELDLAQFNDRVPDTAMVKVLCTQKLLSPEAAAEVQARQVADVLRLGLLWTEGNWEFDSRSHLAEHLNLKVDLAAILRDVPAVVAAPVEPEPVERESDDAEDIESFLDRVKSAKTHYEVLGVQREISAPDLKTVYYQLARRYHPDRFRKSDAALLPQIEAAFARITQAYDTLREGQLRASYDAKVEVRKQAEQIADTAPKASAPAPPAETVAEGGAEPVVSVAQRAETQFKEGFAAFELGQKKVALALFAAAARAVPTDPRYRAFYGQVLAGNEATRRTAEAELSAAVKLDPKNAEYRMMLAELYRDLGLKLRAKGEAERAVAADPNNRKARELLRALK
ncbi:MAG TPA: DnaJ domain-containing protein [Pyrinomonadaceae bacterium]|nr:DnaJ domain-containing protein [Pyrinomonadaceae bacterium]